MAATMEKEGVVLRFGEHGEIIEESTGELLGYAPGYDPDSVVGKSDGRSLIDALSTKFPDNLVQWKKGGASRPNLAYISHAIVTERLNQVFPGWTLTVKQVHTYSLNGTLHCAGVTVAITIGGITRDEMGGPARVEDFATECKNAMSDAVKRCAMRFGVALYLWDKLVDSMTDDDFNSEREPPVAVAPQQTTAPQQPPQAPIRKPQTMRPAAPPQQAPQAPRQRPGVDPASIPGVVRGVANAKPPAPYEEYFDASTRMPAIREYMGSFAPPIVAYGQQNMNDCRKAVNQWVQEHFQTPDAVKGTGDWNEQYKKFDLRPMDIGNALAHFAKQLSTDGVQEAAEAAARDTDDSWPDDPDGPPPF